MEYDLPAIFCDLKINISSKYKWQLKTCLTKGLFPVFTAYREDNDKKYHCMLISNNHKEQKLKLFKECEKYSSIMEIDEIVEIDSITYAFYETGKLLTDIKIDDKKLIKMFIELNEINLSKDMLIYYSYNEFTSKDGEYKILHSSIFRKANNIRTDFALIKAILDIYTWFGLNNYYIKEIYFCIVGMSKCEEKEMREGYLNRKLRMLID